MNNVLKNVIMILVFIVCLALIITGQRTVSAEGLIKELIGLVGLLTLLYVYNRQYK